MKPECQQQRYKVFVVCTSATKKGQMHKLLKNLGNR